MPEPVTVRRRYHDGGVSSWVGDLRDRCTLAACIADMHRHSQPHMACDLIVGMSDGTSVTIKRRLPR